MNPDWSEVSRAPAGGAVIQIMPGAGNDCWVASTAGLFHGQGGVWHMVVNGMPLAQVGAVCVAGKIILAAGITSGIVRSLDGGRSWAVGFTDQISDPVSCIATSPNFAQDGVFLVGTRFDGIYRSTDSGRLWGLSNFGLHNFSILSLVTASDWREREWAFAGSEDGVYLSPNGGRAWKFSGLAGRAVLSLAVSPDFADNRALLAGLESAGLYRSADAGRTWQEVHLGVTGESSVNAICYGQGGRIWVLTQEQGLLVSPDDGETWQVLAGAPEDLFCLAEVGGILYAGGLESGLWTLPSTESVQLGLQGWQQETGLVARRFHWLVQSPSGWRAGGKGGDFLASGLEAGAWLTSENKKPWQQLDLGQMLPASGEAQSILSVTASDEAAWIGTQDGVWCCSFPGAGWKKTLETSQAVTALACAAGSVWAGGAAGGLWFMGKGSDRWLTLPSPATAGKILSLEAAPSLGSSVASPSLLIAALDERRGEVQIWHSSMPMGEKPAWELWLSECSPWRSIRLAFGGPGAGQWAVALGQAIFRQAVTGMTHPGPTTSWLPIWKRVDITTEDAPLNALIWSPRERLWLAAAGETVLVSPDLEAWQPLESWPEGQAVAAFSLSDGEELHALTMDGRLWQWRKAN
jgi:photosystem II stability/assembly factor-like uncharacterized protein